MLSHVVLPKHTRLLLLAHDAHQITQWLKLRVRIEPRPSICLLAAIWNRDRSEQADCEILDGIFALEPKQGFIDAVQRDRFQNGGIRGAWEDPPQVLACFWQALRNSSKLT